MEGVLPMPTKAVVSQEKQMETTTSFSFKFKGSSSTITHGEEEQDPGESREGVEMGKGFQEIPQPRKEPARQPEGDRPKIMSVLDESLRHLQSSN